MNYPPGKINSSYIDYENISVGQIFELTHHITHDDVKTFALLTGDYNPLHMDPEFAKRTMFGKQVVHGMLTASFVSTMIGMLIPGPGALWTSQTIEFLKPAFIDDFVKIIAKVEAKSNASQMLTLRIDIFNQNKIKLITGISTVRLLKMEAPQKKIIMDNFTDKKFKKEIILITGGSRGIGAATAKLLASKGHHVVINYKNGDQNADDLVNNKNESNGQIFAIKGDISNENDTKRLFQKIKGELGLVSAVVHCAAPTPIPQAFDDLDWQEFQKHIDIQIKGAFYCAKYAIPSMIELHSGAFVFLSSIFAEGTPPLQQAPYVTAKAALAALARSLAVEYGPKGIRFNIVSPGMTHTEMIANIPEKSKMIAKLNAPLRKLAEVDDIALTIEFLLSQSARHITGENIRVCGGISM